MRSRTRKGIFWTALILLAALAGGTWFAYVYVTDGTALAALIKQEAPRFLPGGRLKIHSAPLRLLLGELKLEQVEVWQEIDGQEHRALRIDWVSIHCDASALWRGRFVPRTVVMIKPTFRLRRRADGTWNWQGLLADPWPVPATNPKPTVQIKDGKIELCEDDGKIAAILSEVSLLVEPTTPTGTLRFKGDAKGDTFNSLKLSGTIDRRTGRLTLVDAELSALTISETLRHRLPAEVRPAEEQAGLTSGEVDLTVESLTYDPTATPRLRYEASARLRSGLWNCPKLPFPLSDVSADVNARDGLLTIDRAEGHDGKTTVSIRKGGTIDLADPRAGPLKLTVDVVDLELADDRLRAKTPPQFMMLWKEYLPKGRLNLALTAVRERPGGPVGFGMGVDCQDVGMEFIHFRYPLEHLRGTLAWSGERITIDLKTLIGGKPAGARGTIDQPGPGAIARLKFWAESLPIDETLLKAMPADVRKVVDDFSPTGSVRGTADMLRTPPGPGDPPQGKVRIDALIDLNEGCAITWKDLPYPISDLTGRLELHPNSWEFTNMRGRNGLATIKGRGKVDKVGRQLKTNVYIETKNLPFEPRLRAALRNPGWRATWDTLQPSGSSAVDAHFWNDPGRPQHTRLVLVPQPGTRIELKLPRAAGLGGGRGETFTMPPMEQIDGRFEFDDGTVTMSKVRFKFRDSPVQFARGTVTVQDNGQFDLKAWDLEADKFRVDAGLRQIMPPLMAQFARRLDEVRTFRFHTDLGIGWSGLADEPAWCSWENALVVFNGNTIQTGLPLEHLQGQLDHLGGRVDAKGLEVHGAANLDSISLLGQQITGLTARLDVSHDQAVVKDIRGVLLGGQLTGWVKVDLQDTPHYAARLALVAADLQRYTKTMSGRQNFRGRLDAEIGLDGLGSDLHTLQGSGKANISQGELAELPTFLRLVKFLNLSPLTKTAFDSASTEFTIQKGVTHFNPIQLTGNAFSLRGAGTLDSQGAIDLKLHVLYGRDKFHVPLVSDALREASGQIFLIRVQGTPAYPKFGWLPLQPVSNAFRSLGRAARNGPR